MSRQVRYRIAAIMLSGFFFGCAISGERDGERGAGDGPGDDRQPVAGADRGAGAPGAARRAAPPGWSADAAHPGPRPGRGGSDPDAAVRVAAAVDPVQSVDRPRVSRPAAHRSRSSRPHARHTRSGVTTKSTRRSHHATARTKIKPKVKVKTTTGTGGAAAGGSAVPGLDLPSTTAEPRAGAEPTTQLASSQPAAAEPVAAMRPLPAGNQIGLLGGDSRGMRGRRDYRGNSVNRVTTCKSSHCGVAFPAQAPRGGRVQPHRCGRSSPGPTQRKRTGRPAAHEKTDPVPGRGPFRFPRFGSAGPPGYACSVRSVTAVAVHLWVGFHGFSLRATQDLLSRTVRDR